MDTAYSDNYLEMTISATQVGIGADFMFLVPGQKAPTSVETSMESRK